MSKISIQIHNPYRVL